MHHTSVFFNAFGAAAVNGQVPVVEDQVISLRNGNLFPIRDYDLVYAIGGGLTLVDLRLDGATIRQITNPYILPFSGGLPFAGETRAMDLTEFPYRIPSDEELSVQATVSALGDVACVVGLQESFTPLPPGRKYLMRGTSVSVAVANVWTTLAMTWQSNLPSGTYAIVGGVHISANGFAFRFNLENQKLMPGGQSMDVIGNQYPIFQRNGSLGIWGTFDNTALPAPQVYCDGADAVHTVYMQLVKIG